MGRGDDSKLSLEHSADDEAAVRQALGRWGEPAPAAPPPALVARVQAALAEGRPVRDRPRRPRRVWAGVAVALLTPLVLLGLWGVFLDSTGPASLFGDPSSGPGQWVLMVTLAAKPLLNAFLRAGPVLMTLALCAAAAAWLWWRTVRSGAVEAR